MTLQYKQTKRVLFVCNDLSHQIWHFIHHSTLIYMIHN